MSILRQIHTARQSPVVEYRVAGRSPSRPPVPRPVPGNPRPQPRPAPQRPGGGRGGTAARVRPYVTQLMLRRAGEEMGFVDWVLAAHHTASATAHRWRLRTQVIWEPTTHGASTHSHEAPTVPFRVLGGVS